MNPTTPARELLPLIQHLTQQLTQLVTQLATDLAAGPPHPGGGRRGGAAGHPRSRRQPDRRPGCAADRPGAPRTVPCACGQAARYQRQRPATVTTDAAKRTAWAQAQLTARWDGQVGTVLEALEAQRDAGDAVVTTINYSTNQRSRMEYAAYRARGLQIGSGSIESACKQLVASRLKGAGMI